MTRSGGLGQPADKTMHAAPVFADRIAASGLYMAAASITISASMQTAGLLIALLAALLTPACWRWTLRQPLLWLCLALAVFIVLRASSAASEFPDTAAAQHRAAIDWIRLLLFVPLAFWLIAPPERVTRLLVIAALGVVVGTAIAAVQYLQLPGHDSDRFGGMLRKPIVYAFYVSLVFIGTCIWLPEMSAWHRRYRGWKQILLAAALLSALALLAWGFVASRSRTPLLPLVFVLPPLLVVRYARHWKGIGFVRGMLGLVVLLLTAVSIVTSDAIGSRLQEVVTALDAVGTVGLKAAEHDNVTLRLLMWQFGIENWLQRPWLGWGPGSIEMLQRTLGTLPALKDEPWDHLHNAYVQILFCFGAVGALLFGTVFTVLCAALAGRVTREARQVRAPGTPVSDTLSLFLFGILASILVYSLTDFRHLNHDWRTFWLLTAAAATACATSQPPRVTHAVNG